MRKITEVRAGQLIEQGMQLIRKGQELWASTKKLSITVVSRFYNDELLVPFFLDHYSYVDEIVVVLEKSSNDRTRELLSRNSKVRTIEMECKNGYNAREVRDRKIEVINSITTDWVICVDVDEFIFPTGFRDVRKVLNCVSGNIVYANMWQVWKHRDEIDLDPSVKAIHLRRHGPVERGNGINDRQDNKPLIFRSGINMKFGVGFHNFESRSDLIVSTTVFDGAHWKNADPKIAIQRRMQGRRENIATEQLEGGWANDDFNITEAMIIAGCEKHLDDPQLF